MNHCTSKVYVRKSNIDYDQYLREKGRVKCSGVNKVSRCFKSED